MPEEPKKEEPQGNPQQEPKQEPAKTEEPKKETQETPEAQVDWEKRYKDLQSTFNKRDEEVKELGTLKDEVEKWRKLGAVIESDPEKFETIKKWVTVQPAATEANGQAQPDEAKLFIRDNIIDRFEDKYRIKDLEPEKAEALRKKVGTELGIMLKGYFQEGEDLNQTMLKVPLNELPMYFEKAYRLVTSEDKEEEARIRGIAEASQNNQGMIGSIPSSSVKENQVALTDKEKEAARKLGISEKDYAEYKVKQYSNN